MARARLAAQRGVISTLGWVGIFILFAIPVIGLIVAIVWAVGKNTDNLNLRNVSRAYLILLVVGIILSIISYSITRSITGSLFGMFG